MLAASATAGARAARPTASGPTTTVTAAAAAASARPRRSPAARCQAAAEEPRSAAPPATTTRRAALLLLPAAAVAPLVLPPRRALADELAAAAAVPAAAFETQAAAAAAAAAPAASSSPAGLGAATFSPFSEPILAYRLDLPTATTKGEALSLQLSRRPERYSSAAPLSADARQRIVAEWLDLKRFVSVTVTVGPAASPLLRGKNPEEWRPKDVAEAVLTDRSTGRLSSGQRTALMDVERAASDDGRAAPTGRAFTYEYLSQGSPTVAERGRETYRHAVAVSAARYGEDGAAKADAAAAAGGGAAPYYYIWSASFTCPERLWPELEAPFRVAAASFALTEPTGAYVAPDRQSWKFF